MTTNDLPETIDWYRHAMTTNDLPEIIHWYTDMHDKLFI